MGKKPWLPILILVTLVIGLASGWGLGAKCEARLGRTILALQDLEVAGLCTNSLNSMKAGKPEVTRRLLEWRMAAALSRANQKLGEGITLDLEIPNVIRGVQRARRYALENHLTDVVKESDRILKVLQRANEPRWDHSFSDSSPLGTSEGYGDDRLLHLRRRFPAALMLATLLFKPLPRVQESPRFAHVRVEAD